MSDRNESSADQDMLDDEMFVDDDDSAEGQKYLLFHLGSEVYGIDITQVTTIVEIQKITDVPDVPPYLKGVINLRGKVIPVMDMRLRFSMPERPYDDRTCTIVVSIEDSSVGLIVDTVAEVRSIPQADIEPPPSFKGGKHRYISGLGKIDDEVKILIDVTKVLEEGELETFEKIS